MPTATKSLRSKVRERKLTPSRRAHPSPDAGGLQAMRRRYGLSQALLARLLDVSLRTVSAAESAPAIPPPMQRNITQGAGEQLRQGEIPPAELARKLAEGVLGQVVGGKHHTPW